MRRTLIAVCVALAATSVVAAATVAAEPPPKFYVNGKEAGTSRVPTVGWGQTSLESSVLGKVHCSQNMIGEAWNQHEHLEAAKPIRGYSELVGFGSTECEAPQEIPELEALCRKEDPCGPLTVTVTGEMPLERTGRFAEVCIEKTKTLEECSARNAEGMYTERETKQLISEYHRRPTSFPWKAEVIRGIRREEEGVLLRLGLHEFGEPGSVPLHNTKCYPKAGELPASFKALPGGCIGINIVFPQIPVEFVYYGSQEIWMTNGVKNGLFPSKLEFIEAGTLFSNEGLEGEAVLTGTFKLTGAANSELLTAH